MKLSVGQPVSTTFTSQICTVSLRRFYSRLLHRLSARRLFSADYKLTRPQIYLKNESVDFLAGNAHVSELWTSGPQGKNTTGRSRGMMHWKTKNNFNRSKFCASYRNTLFTTNHWKSLRIAANYSVMDAIPKCVPVSFTFK